MKSHLWPVRLWAAVLGLCTGIVSVAQTTVVTEERIKERGPHHQVVEMVRQQPDAAGKQINVTNSYVQLESGLNFRNSAGEWEESRAELVSEHGWAVARKGQHQVALYHNLNAEGAVVLHTPDGKRLRSHVYGLAYYDTATGQSVLIAAVKDSEAQLTADNELIYPDAFQELAADVRYTYTKSGFEQDIILREQPPAPEKFGFNADSTMLEVWTEFVEAERPGKSFRTLNPKAVARGAEVPLVDEDLSFGELKIGQGRTFALGREDEALSLVAKNWVETEDGGKFLVETVAMDSLAAGLDQLPAGKGGAQLRRPHRGRLLAGYRAPARVPARESVQVSIPRLNRGRDLARLDALRRPGLVLDYQAVSGSLSSYTFRHDTTYHVTGSVTATGTTTFDGGTVIKYANTGSPTINLSGTLVWRGEMYRPVIMTAKDDNTVGEAIAGSTGTPSGYYAHRALNITGTSTTTMTLTHFRISYAQTAIGANNFSGASYPLVLRHGQIVNCQTAYTFGYGTSSAATFKLQNNLVVNANRVLENLYGAWVQGEHLTVNGGTALNYNPSSSTVVLNNSLITGVTATTGYTGTATTVLSSGTGVYVTAGGGNHYLAEDTYRNNATASIDTTLAGDLKRMTTYRPSTLSAAISVSTRLQPQVALDTDTFDRGYHYPPVDFVTSTLQVTKGALTLADGVAIAHSGSASIWLQAGSKLVSKGLPERMNVLSRYTSVQETAITGAPAHTPGWVTVNTGGSAANPPAIDCRFSAFYADQGDFHLYSDGVTSGSFPAESISLKDCQVYGGRCSFYNDDAPSLPVSLLNSLWIQTYLYCEANVSLTAYNQLWWRSTFEFLDGTGSSMVRNSVFDNTTVTVESTAIVNSHNGYVPTTAVKLPGTLGSDQTTASFSYANPSGGLGAWYQSTTDFQNDGNHTASSAGLAQHTVLATQTKDSGNVDLGFHYIAVNTGTRLASDADGDSLRDYLEDADGDGQLDTGETDVALADSDRDGRTDQEELADGTNPRDATDVKHGLLTRWLFDNSNNWTATGGQVPLVETYTGYAAARTVTGFSGQAASFVLGSNPATEITARQLNYKWAEANSKPNLTFSYGSVRFWFKPNWASANAGGSGPGAEARLLNLGIPVVNTAGNGWWAVYVEPNGNQLTVGTQAPSTASQIKLSADISWKINTWHFVEVTYNSQSTYIYVDGKLTKTGAPPAAAPNSTALGLGFAVGSDMSGLLSAKGRIDRLETYNYPQAEEECWAEYKAVTSVDGDSDLLNDVTENEVGTNPALADHDGDGMRDGWEYAYGLNPLSNADATLDSDSDGPNNLTEHNAKTDPRDNEAAVRAPVPVLTDTFQKALDQKHLINVDLGASKTITITGPKAAGFNSTDYWNPVLDGPQEFEDGLPVPELMQGKLLNYAFSASTPSGVKIWSGFGPCYESGYWGVQMGQAVWIPRWGGKNPTDCPTTKPTSCFNMNLSIQELIECVLAHKEQEQSRCLNVPVQNVTPNGLGASALSIQAFWWPSFGSSGKGQGSYLPGLNDLLPADPNDNTVDDVLVARFLTVTGLQDLETGDATTRTVLSGLKAKPYRLYVKGTFDGIRSTEVAEQGAITDSGVTFIGEVAGSRRYLVEPEAGAVTILNSQQLAWLQLVELDPLPAPLITSSIASYTAARLVWNAVPTAETYSVYRREGSSGNFSQVGTTAALGFIDGALKNGTSYTYYVEAGNEALESPRSATVTVTTRAADSFRHNQAPALYRPDPIQFAERNMPFKLTVPQLQAVTRASDPENNPISFRIDSIPAGQILKLNGVTPNIPVQFNPGDVLEWTAPNYSSEQGVIAFHLSAFDGFQTSVDSVPVPIAVKSPSVLYGWGYSGVGNLAQGGGTQILNIDLSSDTNPDNMAAYNRQWGLVAGYDLKRILGEQTDLRREIESAWERSSWASAVLTEPAALAQSSGAVTEPIRSVRRIVPGLLTEENFMALDMVFGIANGVVRNDGQLQMWGFDYLKGLFGPAETALYADANFLPLENDHFRKQPNSAYVYDTAIPFKMPNGAGGYSIWNQVSDASLGSQHGLAVTHSGEVYSWGGDWIPNGKAVSALSAPSRPAGTLAIRGANSEYWVGFDRFGVAHAPLPVSGLNNIVTVLADHSASFALSSDGTVWYWGTLGDVWMTEEDANTSGIPIDVTHPRRMKFSGVTSGNEPKIKQIAGSGGHYAFLDTAGNVWEFGYMPRLRIAAGQKLPQTSHYRYVAEKTPGAAGIKKVACGREYLLALQESGAVLSWGALFHSDSLGRRSDSSVPRAIAGLSRIRDIAVSPGDEWGCPGRFDPLPSYSDNNSNRELRHFALACDEFGTVWAWGSNAYGALGDDDRSILTDAPQRVIGMSDAASVAAGPYSSFAVARFDQTTPVSLKAIAGNQKVELTWRRFFNATDYVIERTTQPTQPNTFAQVGISVGNKFTDRAVFNGQNYHYRVRARVNNGTSLVTTDPSPVVQARPSAPPSVAPANVVVIALCKAIEIRWDSLDGATSFRVFRTGGAASGSVLIGEVDAESNYLVDKTVVTGTSYSYSVAAVNGGGFGPVSAPTAATSCNNTLCPPAPSNLVASTPAAETVRLQWVDPDPSGMTLPGGATASLVKCIVKQRYKDSKGIWFTKIAEVSPGIEVYDHAGIAAGWPKYYTVSAVVRITGNGPAYLVESDDATPVDAMAYGGVAPGIIAGLSGQGLKIQPEDDATAKVAAFISWTDDPNATYFEVQRTTTSQNFTGAPTIRQEDHRYLDTTVSAGTTYYYRMRGMGNGSGNWSDQPGGPGQIAVAVPASGLTPSATAVPKTVLQASGFDGRILLKWPPQDPPKMQYPSGVTFMLGRMLSATPATNPGYRPITEDPPAYGLSFVDDEVLNQTTYNYRLLAFDSAGALLTWSVGPASDFANATPTGTGAAWNFTATPGNEHVRLTWNALGATGYKIRWSTEPGGRSTQVAEIPGTSYYHTGLQNGQTYYYTVTAVVNGAGDIQTSPEVAATPLGTLAPLPPAGIRVSFTRSQVDPPQSPPQFRSAAAWRSSAGAVKYWVERGFGVLGEENTPPTIWSGVVTAVSDPVFREMANETFNPVRVWYRVKAENAAGLQSDWAQGGADFQQPGDASTAMGTVTLVAPTANAVIVTPTNLFLRATSKLPNVVRMEFYDGEAFLGFADTAPWQFNWHNVPSGIKSLRAYAVSKADNGSFFGEYSDPVTVTVQWASPLNDYQTAATDLTIPSTGLPITVERSYNSGRVNEQGVLGRGWQASWDRAKLVVGNGGDLGTKWGPGAQSGNVYSIAELTAHPVTITLAGGEEVAFMAQLRVGNGGNAVTGGNPLHAAISSLAFEPTETGSGTLVCDEMQDLGLGTAYENYSGAWADAGELKVFLRESPLEAVAPPEAYNTRAYEFTYLSSDGVSHVFHNYDGSDTWRLKSVTDRNGHSLVYTYETSPPYRLLGIDHDANASSRDISITYVTDNNPTPPTETISIFDPIELAKTQVLDRRAAIKYVVALTASGRQLREVHRLSRRNVVSPVQDERYEVVRYTYGAAAHDLNRLTKIEAGLARYPNTNPAGEPDTVATVASMPWLQVLLNTYESTSQSDPSIYGKLKSQTDARGNSSTLTPTGTTGSTPVVTAQTTVTGTVGGPTVTETVKHNTSGEITEVTQAGATVPTKFTYNEKGLLLTETDPAGKTKTYHYDRQDRLTGVTDETGKGDSTAFNPDGSVDYTEDANGNVTSFSYDANGNLEVSKDSTGTVTTRVYYTAPADAKWFGLVRRESRQVPGLLKPLVTDYEYTPQGDLLREINYTEQEDAPPVGTQPTTQKFAETMYSYDGNGNRLTETRWPKVNGARMATTTTHAYDAQNRTLTTRDPLHSGNPTDTLRETLTTYDVFGRTAKTRDLLGNVTEMYYDPTGNLIQTVYPDGTVSRTVYDERNRPRFSQDRLVPSNLAYCQSPSQTTLTTGPGTETLYDAAGRTVGTRRWASFTVKKVPASSPVVGPNQIVALLSDTSGNVLTAVAGSPYSATRTVYDAAGRVKYSIDANGMVTESQYDDAGRRTKTLVYTAYPAPFNDYTSVIAPTGNSLVTTYGYDANGNQLWMLDAKGQAVAVAQNYAPDSAGHQLLRTDYRYDEGNRRILTYFPFVSGDPDRKFRQTIYDSLGRRSVEFDEAGVATAFGYDNLGRLTSVTNDFRLDLTTPITRYEYDEVGNQTKQTDALGRVTQFEYDKLGRRTKRILPTTGADGANEIVAYSIASGSDGMGAYNFERRVVTAFNGRRLTFDNDRMGRLKQKKLEIPTWTTEATLDFAYAPQGWLKKVSETRAGASARYTFFDYDAYGRLTKKDSPEGVLAYQYLASGAVDTIRGYPRSVVAQPANPATATDALALPTSPTPVPDASLKYEYDRLGRLERVSDLNGTDSASTTDHTAKTLYAYDANGNLDNVRYPDNGGLRVEHKYTYTTQNRLKQLDLRRVNSSGVVSTAILSFQYRLNASGQRAAVIEDDQPASQGSPRAVLYAYDTDDADNTPGTPTPDPNPLVRLNRLSQELVTTYEEGGQVFTELTGNSPHFLHKYDVVGNRTYSKQALTPTVPASVLTLSPSYDNRDRLDANSTPTDANAIYDANGNTLALKNLTLGVAVYDESPNNAAGNVPAGDTYDSENRLVKRVVREAYDANNWKQTTLVLTYDHAGNRVSKVKTVENRLKVSPYTASGTTTTTTTYLVDELNPTGYAQVLAEYQQVGAGSLTLQRAYAYGLDLISQRIGGGTIRDYYGYDGHGSVRRLLTVAGARVLGSGTLPDYTYDAYGRLLTTTDTATPRNLYRYAGEQWDADLGMSYNRARYLSTATGRFWSMDSYEGDRYEPTSLHKYLYAHADPVTNTDPSGKSIGGLTDLMATMMIKVQNYAQRSARFRRVIDKSYYPIVTTYVVANLFMGIGDPAIAPAAIAATPYQYLLLRDFNKNGNRIRTTTATRIRRLATSFGRATMGSVSAAAAGVQIKSNGFPDFSPFQHPILGLVFLPNGLTGNRYQDEKLANQLTGRAATGTPDGYVWHHHEIVGVMQLVQSSKHNTTEKGAAHDGGALYWSILKDADYK